jgi:hypothetical protein
MSEEQETTVQREKAQRFLAIIKYDDGGEATMEMFETQEMCLAWIVKQPKPKNGKWCVGEY